MEIKILEVAGLGPAIRAMRLPMKSGDKSDTKGCWDLRCVDCPLYENESLACDKNVYSPVVIGLKDHDLSMKLIKAGSDHRKHIRLIDVWMEITASRAFWHEMATYRMGVDGVSESTVHRILKDEITSKDFDERTPDFLIDAFKSFVDVSKDAICDPVIKFNKIKMALPEGYLQQRILKLSYEALRNIYQARHNHPMQEWKGLCKVIESLPYSEFITED